MTKRTGPAWNLRTTRRAITTLTVAAFPILLIGVTWAKFPETPEEFRDRSPETNLLGTAVPSRSKRRKRERNSTRKKGSGGKNRRRDRAD